MAAGDLSLNIIIGATLGGSFGAIIGSVQSAITNLASGNVMGAITSAAAGVGAALIDATQKAGDFQQQLTILSTSAGESANNLKSIGEGILQISTDTGTTTQQLTSAMYYVESAGNHGADALKVLGIAAEGAKTENADLTTVAKALTGVLTDYHLPVSDASAAMNGLIEAVKNGKTSLQDLSGVMGNVLPIADKLGVSFPQVAAAMDVMTNANVPARQASQNLAHVLLALEAPSNVAADSMKTVGLSAQQVKDTLVSQGLPQALQLIEDHVGNTFPKDSTQSVEALKNILGGLVGFKTAAMLTGDSLSAFEADIAKVTGAMNTGKDAVLGWEAVQQNFNTQVDRLKASFDALLIVIGQQILPAITPVVQGFANAIVTFTSFISSIGTAATDTSTFGQIIGLLGTTFSYTKDIISSVVSTLGTLFTDAVTVANGVLGTFVKNTIIEAIAEFNGFLYAVRQVVDEINTFVNTLTDDLQPIIDTLKPIFDSLSSAAETWGNNMMVAFGNGIIAAGNEVIAAVEQIAQTIADYLGFSSPTKKGPGSTLNEWGIGMVSGLVDGIINSIPLVSDAVNQVASTLTKVSTAGGGAFNSASANMLDTTSGDTMKVSAIPESQTKATVAAANTTGTSAGTTLTKALTASLGSGASAVNTAATAVASTTSAVCTASKAAASCAADNLTTQLASQTAANTAAVKAAAQKVGDATNAAATAAQKAADAAHQALTTNLAKKTAADTPAVAGAASNLANMVKTPVNSIQGAVTNASNALKSIAANSALAAKNISNSLTGLPAIIQQIQADMKQWGDQAKVVLQQMGTDLASVAKVSQSQLTPSLGGFYNSVLKPMVDEIGYLVAQSIAATVNFGKWAVSSGMLKGAWDELILGMKAIISVGATIVTLIGQDLQAPMKQLSTTINTQLGPAWSALMKSIQPMVPVMQLLAKVVGGVLLVALGLVIAVLNGLIRAFAGLLTGAIQVFGGLVQIIGGALTTINGFITMVIGALKYLFTGNADMMEQGSKSMWDGIVQIWEGAGNVIMGLVRGLWRTISGFFGGIYDGIVTYFTNLYNALVGHSLVPDIVNGIIALFQKLVDFLPGVVSKFIASCVAWWNSVKTETQKDAQAVITAITDIFQKAWDAVSSALQSFTSGWNTFWATVKTDATTGVNTAWTTVKSIFSNAWSTVGPGLVSFVTGLGQWFTTLGNSIKTWTDNLFTMMENQVKAAITPVTNVFTSIAQSIKNVLGISSPAAEGPLSTADQWIPNLMNMFATQVKQKEPAITQEVTDFANGIAKQFTDLSGKVTTNTNQINTSMSNLTNQVAQTQQKTTSQMNLLTSSVSSATNTIDNNINTLTSNTQSNIQYLNDVIQTGTTKMNTWVTTIGNTTQQANTQINSSMQYAQSSMHTVVSDVSQTDQQVNQSMSNTTQKVQQTKSQTQGLLQEMGSNASSYFQYLQGLATGNKAEMTQAANSITQTWNQDNQQWIAMGQSALAFAASVAVQIGMVLAAHSPTESGPLADSDTWMPNLISMLGQGLVDGAPKIYSAATVAASGVTKAFNEAVTASGDTLSALGTTASTAITASTSSLTASPTLTTTEPDQNQTIYVTLDGKTIAKTVSKYQVKELRVQGVVRGQ